MVWIPLAELNDCTVSFLLAALGPNYIRAHPFFFIFEEVHPTAEPLKSNWVYDTGAKRQHQKMNGSFESIIVMIVKYESGCS